MKLYIYIDDNIAMHEFFAVFSKEVYNVNFLTSLRKSLHLIKPPITFRLKLPAGID